MFAFICDMIQMVPTITRKTISTPNANASTLLVLSGPLVMWRKKTRWTPIWAMARTTRPVATPGPHRVLVDATQNEMPVSASARPRPTT